MATKFFGTISLVLIILAAPAAVADPFATTIYDSSGLVEGYDATTTLGSPTTSVYDSWEAADMDISMVYGAWGTDNVALFAPGGYVIVQFDTPVVNNPLNPYGADFIIFGNSAFLGQAGWVQADTDMASYAIAEGGAAFGVDAMSVSVSANGDDWLTFTSPLAGGLWPTQAYSAWDAQAGAWDHNSPADFTLPMNPNLTPEQFGGLTAVEALALYGGSGGGMAFDIGQLGLDEISFIRVDGPGVIDAFAKVSPVPEPATAAILLLGAAGILIRRRNRK